MIKRAEAAKEEEGSGRGKVEGGEGDDEEE